MLQARTNAADYVTTANYCPSRPVGFRPPSVVVRVELMLLIC